MKKIAFLLALAFTLSVRADDAAPNQLVDTDSGKAVTFHETVSSDGHYAIGWLLRPHTKKPAPIDWSLWNAEDSRKFIETYAAYLPGDIAADDDYELIDCVIDLKAKKLLQLPTTEVYFPEKPHGDISVAWSPAGQGPRCVLVQYDVQSWTENFWLIRLDSDGMHQMDIAQTLQKAVAPIIEEKRPLVHNGFETTFPLNPNDTTSAPVAFHDSTVTIPFWSDVPKGVEDDTSIEGTLTVKLPEGTILTIISPTPSDDPLKDVPELAKADHELNHVYSQLSQKLSSKQREDLKTQQLAWIDQRDTYARDAYDTAHGDSRVKDPRGPRNKSLLESTQQRLKDLQDRLNALH